MSVSQSLTLTESNVVNSANTSRVRILWKSTQSGDSWNGYTRTAKYYVSINGGAETEHLVNYTLPQNSTATIVDTTITINHKSDGSGTVAVRTWMDTRISAGVVTQSKSLNLTTIPRASSLDALSCSTAYLNGTLTYKYSPKSASFYNKCVIALNLNGAFTTVKTVNIGQKAASQQTATVTLSESELSTIYNKLPSTKKGTLRFTFTTYSNSGYSTQIGDAVNKEITLTIPDIDATKPTATMTLTPVSTLHSTFNGLYIKGKSKVQVNLDSGVGKYGATIASYKVSVGSASGNAPYTSGYFTKAENVTITGTVTDSRGYSRKYTQTITVQDYKAPQILPVSGESEVIAARCDSSGKLSDTGTYLKIKAKRSYTKVNASGVNKNFCYIAYRYKVEGKSYSAWSMILATTATSDEIVTGALLGTLDIKSTYLVQVQAVDTVGEMALTTISLPTERVYLHKAGSINSFGVGKYAEDENTVDIAEDMTVKVRGNLIVGDREISDSGWIDIGLSDEVATSSEAIGRVDKGTCCYRVVNGNHIYVAFNCAYTYVNSQMQVNSSSIPAAYRPDRIVCAICATGGRFLTRVFVNNSGNIIVDWVQSIQSGEQTKSSTVSWIDGYIDYWI